MGEIRTSDLNEIKTPEKTGYQEIKPENGMTQNEADKFWNKEINESKNRDTASDIYTDDNGRIYKKGTDLVPNNQFEVDGFKYETDEIGRTKSVEGILSIPPKKERCLDSMEAVGKGDQQEGDDRGHLIAHRFGGSDKVENLVAMDAKLNRGEYEKMENELADAVKDGADVRMKVEPVYQGDSHRPSEIRVTYSINGDISVKVFRNGGNK